MTRTSLAVTWLSAALLCASAAWGQDPHLSQFYTAPQLINPAMTGVFQGQFRTSVNYREQWSTVFTPVPFRTMAAGFDMRHNILDDDYLAWGVQLIRNEAGTARFTRTYGDLGVSYLKQLGGDRYSRSSQYLVAGVQAGFGQHALQTKGFWFSRQFDTAKAVVNPTLPSGEIFNGDLAGNVFLNLNAGLLWYAVLGDNKSLYVGGAFQHANQPQVRLYDGQKENLLRRYTAHAGGEIPLSDEMSLLPAVVWMKQGASMQVMGGAAVRFSRHEWQEVALRAGVWARVTNKLTDALHQDALIVSTFLETERWNIGLSYDLNTSSLANATNTRGAFEISLLYIHPETKRMRLQCPKM